MPAPRHVWTDPHVQDVPRPPPHIIYESRLIIAATSSACTAYASKQLDPYAQTLGLTRTSGVRKRLPRGCPGWWYVVDPETGQDDPLRAQAVVDDLHRRIRLGPLSRICFLRDGAAIAPILLRDQGLCPSRVHNRIGLEWHGASPQYQGRQPTVTPDGRPIHGGAFLLPSKYVEIPMLGADGGLTHGSTFPWCQWTAQDYPDLPPPPPPPSGVDETIPDYPWEECDGHDACPPPRDACSSDPLRDLLVHPGRGGPEWCELHNVRRYLATFGPLELVYGMPDGQADDATLARMESLIRAAIGTRGRLYVDIVPTGAASLRISLPPGSPTQVDLSRPLPMKALGSAFADSALVARRACLWSFAPAMPWNTPATMDAERTSPAVAATRQVLERLRAAARVRRQRQPGEVIAPPRTFLEDEFVSDTDAAEHIRRQLRTVGVYGAHFLTFERRGRRVRTQGRRWGVDPLPDLVALAQTAGAALADHRVATSRLERPRMPRHTYEQTLGSQGIDRRLRTHGLSVPTSLCGYPMSMCIFDGPAHPSIDTCGIQ